MDQQRLGFGPSHVPCYVPVISKTAHSRPHTGAFDFCEKFSSNSPLCCQVRRSNAPPVRASNRVKSFIQMYIFCNTANIYLWKKTHPTNDTCKLRRSRKENMNINLRDPSWHVAFYSVMPCTHEINEYKQNRFNTFGNKFCKIFSHYEFLVQLVFASHFKQRHIPRYN